MLDHTNQSYRYGDLKPTEILTGQFSAVYSDGIYLKIGDVPSGLPVDLLSNKIVWSNWLNRPWRDLANELLWAATAPATKLRLAP
jgi:hypothetical protein